MYVGHERIKGSGEEETDFSQFFLFRANVEGYLWSLSLDCLLMAVGWLGSV